MKKLNEDLWNKCLAFHGHECPGLTIGYRAALYAIELLGLTFSDDEQVVCISENDACGCDAIQVILGCSIGKGNFLFHMTGKQAFSFYDRKTDKSVRLLLKNDGQERSRDESFQYYHSCKSEEMFSVLETKIKLPERARMFDSYVCECCGETAGANWIRIANGKKVCVDCYTEYDRFHV